MFLGSIVGEFLKNYLFISGVTFLVFIGLLDVCFIGVNFIKLSEENIKKNYFHEIIIFLLNIYCP